ncbi:hypothetical protein [Thermococcus sibiricus]|nr:hypothetical protein [Thermococcus sibiricus]
MTIMGEEKSKIIRVNIDEYNYLDNLKKIFGNDKVTYADLIAVGMVFTKVFLEQDPILVRNIGNAAKMLRLKRKRGEPVNILDSLVEEYREQILRKSSKDENVRKVVIDVIEILLDDGHIEAATDLLFAYRSLIDEAQFKDLSTKILERQVQLKHELMKTEKT